MGGVKPESKNSRRFMMPRDPPDTLHSTEGTAFQPLRKYTQITVKICKISKTCVCVHAQSARLSAIPWTIQHTRLLRPWDFPQAEYKDGLLFPPPGYLPKPGTKPESPAAPALAGGFLLLSHLGSLSKKEKQEILTLQDAGSWHQGLCSL